MFTEKIFDTGTIKINYAEGPFNGKPFVLLHGATARWQELIHLLNGLENDWHLYACDARGHGKSGWSDSYTVTAVANDMAEFIKRNVGEPVVLLGHSAGAVASLVVASQIPEWIKALIVLDPPLLLREQGVRSENTNQYFLRLYDLLTHQRPAEEVFSELFPNIDEAGRRYFEETYSGLDPRYVKTAIVGGYLDGVDLQTVMEKIACPALLIYGEVDKGGLVRESDVEFFKTHVNNGTAIQIKDTGHLFHMDQPVKTLELIGQWLKK
ncbi:MAG: alpha/beta hydrolase [Anaerolineales bacterium]|nr:alpha/beta hydrolase [Anaerolineales bacterium]